MDIQARKLHFIQEFLKVQSEEVLTRLENILTKSEKAEFKPMSMEQFNTEIDKSYKDSISGNVITSQELKEEIKEWS